MLKKNFLKILLVFFAAFGSSLAIIFFESYSLFIVLGAIVFLAFVLAIFRNPLWGIFFIAFFLPFERIGSFEVLGITVRLSQIFALAVIFALFLTFLARKTTLEAKNPLITPLFIFQGLALLSMIKAINLERAILVFLFNFFVILFSLIIPNLVKTKKDIRRIVFILLLSSFIVSIFGLYQFVGDMLGLPKEITGLREHYTKQVFGFPRIQSTALEPLYFANFLLIPISLALALFLSRKKEDGQKAEKLDRFLQNKFFLFIILSLAMVNLVLTLSRGGFLALVFILFLFLLFYLRSILSLKNLLILALVFLLVIISAQVFLKITGRAKNVDVFLKQAQSLTAGVGIEERYITYSQALKMIWQHPWLGVGVGNFGPNVAKNPNSQPEQGWPIVNNEFLEIWAEQGVFSLIIFIILILILIIRTIKAALSSTDFFLKLSLAGFFIAFLGILVQYQTFSTLYILHIWFVIGILVALQNIIFEKTQAGV